MPDIALVDVAMPDISRPELITHPQTPQAQGTRVVFFAGTARDRELQRLAAGGACIVLMKDAKPEVLVATLRKVAQSQGLASRSPEEPRAQVGRSR